MRLRLLAIQAPLSTPVDDMHSVLKYEIEVVNLQINLEAETAQVCTAASVHMPHPGILGSSDPRP